MSRRSGTLIGDSPVSKYGAVFEDDGETGYFYGLDTTIQDSPILDALHVYDVQAVTDRAQESKYQIVWSGDGMR